MRVALVHEFLTQRGGAERILQEFHLLFPDAPVYTLLYDETRTGEAFSGWDIRPSFLQRLPWVKKKYKWSLPLMREAIESFDLSGYDLVLSDSSAFAKGVITKPPTKHVCYCHTPTRYLWEGTDEYVDKLPYGSVIKALAKFYLQRFLKKWDFQASKRPDFLIANSQTVKARIKKYYQRDSAVIYPPVDCERFIPDHPKEDYFFAISRLEPYKKMSLVIEAFNKLGLSLKIAGIGTELTKLKNMAGKNVEFLGYVPDAELPQFYGKARALVFPALEDAGIVVLESLACGTPVIGFAQGGTAEFVQDGLTGILFKNQTSEDIVESLARFEHARFSPQILRSSAERHDRKNFQKQIESFLKTNISRITI